MTDFALRPPDLVNLAGIDTGREHLSTSSIGLLLACQQKFNLHYVERLRQAVTPSPLALGRGFADALQAGDPEIAWNVVTESALAEREEYAGNPWISLPTEEDTEIGATIARAAARCYLAEYGTQATREVELRSRIRNPAVGGRVSPTHDIMARVDGVDLDGRVLIEDKLAGSQSKIHLDKRVRLDRQITIGAYLLWRVYGIEDLEIRYRVTMKPGIRRRQNESHAAFVERIDRDYAERPDFYLTEEVAHRTGDDFLRLERELWRWQSMVRDSRADGTWPRNTSACLAHGSCRFLALCAGEAGAIHQFVTEDNRQGVAA